MSNSTGPIVSSSGAGGVEHETPAAGGAAPTGGVPAPAAAPLRERASVFTDEISLDFAEACQAAAAAGLRYVDVRKLWGGFSHEVPRRRWPEMARILQDNGLRLGAIQSNFGKCAISGPEYDEHIRFFPILVEQAHYFGTDVMRVFPFWSEVRMTDDIRQEGAVRPNLEAMLPQIVRQFRPAAELAQRSGIRLGFEPEHTTHSGSPQEVARIVDALDNPKVGVAWDVNNGWDEATVEVAYALFRGKIVNVHVKERGPVRGTRMLLGQGVIPWREVVGMLERDGYGGVYSIETHYGARGTYGWPKLKAATTYFMYALRELLEESEVGVAGAAA